eukprot:m.207692 g.207692  ORF g.207692 m.207692 type:complete len:915 (+) comp15805_c0_seq3:240-2984(+)
MEETEEKKKVPPPAPKRTDSLATKTGAPPPPQRKDSVLTSKKEKVVENERTLQIKLEGGGLGIKLQSGKQKHGTRVVLVQKGSPAETAGVKIGDVILAVDDIPVFNQAHAKVEEELKKGVAAGMFNLHVCTQKHADKLVAIEQMQAEKPAIAVEPKPRPQPRVKRQTSENSDLSEKVKVEHVERTPSDLPAPPTREPPKAPPEKLEVVDTTNKNIKEPAAEDATDLTQTPKEDQTEKNDANNDVSIYETEIKMLRAQMKELSDDMKKQVEKSKENEEQIKDLKSAEGLMKLKLQKSELEAAAEKKRKEKISKELEKLQQEFNAVKDKTESDASQIASLKQNEQIALEREENFKKATEEIQALQDKLNLAVKENEATKSLAQAAETDQNLLKSVQEELKIAQDKIVQLEAERDSRDKDHASMMKAIEVSKSEMEVENKKKDELLTEQAKTIEDLKTKILENKEAENEIGQVTEEKNLLVSKVQKLSTEKQSLETKVSSLEAVTEGQVKEISQLKSELEKLQASSEAAKTTKNQDKRPALPPPRVTNKMEKDATQNDDTPSEISETNTADDLPPLEVRSRSVSPIKPQDGQQDKKQDDQKDTVATEPKPAKTEISHATKPPPPRVTTSSSAKPPPPASKNPFRSATPPPAAKASPVVARKNTEQASAPTGKKATNPFDAGFKKPPPPVKPKKSPIPTPEPRSNPESPAANKPAPSPDKKGINSTLENLLGKGMVPGMPRPRPKSMAPSPTSAPKPASRVPQIKAEDVDGDDETSAPATSDNDMFSGIGLSVSTLDTSAQKKKRHASMSASVKRRPPSRKSIARAKSPVEGLVVSEEANKVDTMAKLTGSSAKEEMEAQVDVEVTKAPPIAVDSATGDEATDDDENNDSSVKKKGWKSKIGFGKRKGKSDTKSETKA